MDVIDTPEMPEEWPGDRGSWHRFVQSAANKLLESFSQAGPVFIAVECNGSPHFLSIKKARDNGYLTPAEFAESFAIKPAAVHRIVSRRWDEMAYHLSIKIQLEGMEKPYILLSPGAQMAVKLSLPASAGTLGRAARDTALSLFRRTEGE